MLGMNKDCQKQLLAKSPKTAKDLLLALNNVIVHSLAHADRHLTTRKKAENASQVDANSIVTREQMNAEAKERSLGSEGMERQVKCKDNASVSYNDRAVVYLLETNILHAEMKINGRGTHVLVDTGVSVSHT